MAFLTSPHGTHEERGIHEREQLGRLPGRDEFGLHPQVTPAGMHHLEPVHPLRGVGQLQPARHVDTAVLSRCSLELRIQFHRVPLEIGEVDVAVVGVDVTGRVPGRSGGQLETLDQHHVGPSRLGQVVQHRAPDHATTDHHDLGLRLQAKPPRWGCGQPVRQPETFPSGPEDIWGLARKRESRER